MITSVITSINYKFSFKTIYYGMIIVIDIHLHYQVIKGGYKNERKDDNHKSCLKSRRSTRTFRKWEAKGMVGKAKRGWRGWRVYNHDDVEELITFHDTIVKYE